MVGQKFGLIGKDTGDVAQQGIGSGSGRLLMSGQSHLPAMKPIGQATLLQKSNDAWAPFPVEVIWLNDPADWSFVSAWHSSGGASDSASLRDSLEYAALAGIRWRYLNDLGLAPASPAELRHRAGRQPTGEFGVALALRERTPGGSILGFAFARRT